MPDNLDYLPMCLCIHGSLTILFSRDKSASATYYLKEDGPSFQDPQWIPYHRLTENEDEFQMRNSQVFYTLH
jgi:hypothetical protein